MKKHTQNWIACEKDFLAHASQLWFIFTVAFAENGTILYTIAKQDSLLYDWQWQEVTKSN